MSASRRVLVTGGAGFVGANLAVALASRPGFEVTVLDNLKRRGSELNLPRLRGAGVAFVHGDVRAQGDLLELDPIDALVEASAEPSALAGLEGSPGYLLDTNLTGARHCLELARRDGAQVVFLSTSRVYPVAALESLSYSEGATRFELRAEQELPGASQAGIAEAFPLTGARTLYGASKLAAELLVTEYGSSYGLSTVVNRCGVIAGPWQMGRVDQGVFGFWVLAHHLGRDLRYLGYGGSGKQVRDLLHVDDLAALIVEQLEGPERWRGKTFNVGGGREVSLSLREASEICAELTGTRVAVGAERNARPGDVPLYLSDCTALHGHTSWRPTRDARTILGDTLGWVREHEDQLVGAL